VLSFSFKESLVQTPEFFEPFWDSQAPRIGEPRSVGWDGWLKGVKNEESTCGPTFFDVLEADLAGKGEKEKFLFVELNREDVEFLPWRKSHQHEAEDDEYPADLSRVVFFDDIADYLFKITYEQSKIEVLLNFVVFLGSNIPTYSRCSGSLADHYKSLSLQHATLFTAPLLSALSHAKHLELLGKRPSSQANIAFTHFEYDYMCGWHRHWAAPAPQGAHDMALAILESAIGRYPSSVDLRLAHIMLHIPVDSTLRGYRAAAGVVRSHLAALSALGGCPSGLLRLWALYVTLQRRGGRHKDAVKVTFSVLQMFFPLRFSNDEYFLLAWVHCWYLLSLKKVNIAIRLLYLLAEDKASPEVFIVLEEKSISKEDALGFEKLKCLRANKKYGDLLNSSTHQHFDFLRLCSFLLILLTESFATLHSHFHAFMNERLPNERSSSERALPCHTHVHSDFSSCPFMSRGEREGSVEMVICSFVHMSLYYVEETFFEIRNLRTLLEEVIPIFPCNTYLLSVYVYLQKRSHSMICSRRFFSNLRSEHPLNTNKLVSPIKVSGVSLYFFSLLNEIQFSIQNPQSSTLISIFEEFANDSTLKHSSFLWALYISYSVTTELSNLDLFKQYVSYDCKQIEGIVYRALQCCPTSKHLYMLGIKFTSDWVRLLDLMQEKELRVRTPLEELKILS
jgi:hypothetical protein